MSLSWASTRFEKPWKEFILKGQSEINIDLKDVSVIYVVSVECL